MQNWYPFDKSVHDLTIDDLHKLVDDKVKAGYYIEYHNISDNETDLMRKPKINKIVRAITSFANTKGGWCILGVNADNKYGTMSLKTGTTLKQINAYYNSIKKQIDSELFSKIERRDIPLENTVQSNLVSVIYIPCQSGKEFVFKDDNNGERIYRRFNDAFVPFPDIRGRTVQPFYQYHRIEDIPEQINEIKSTFNQEQHEVFLKIKNIWRLREFHQDNEFKIEKLNELKEYIQPQKTEQIIVYNIDGFLVLVDGFYRVAASIEANLEEICATVKVGTREEALQESCTANKEKDKERSDATRVRTLETYLAAKGDSINDPFNYSNVYTAIGIKQKFIKGHKEYINNKINNNNQKEVLILPDITQKFAFPENELDRWIRIIERKKQVIIYGPPGTGKTFLAKDLAKHLTKTGDEGKGTRWDIVQFHPSYSYEDFIQGIRPEIVKEKSQDEPSTDEQLSREVNGQIKYKWEKGRFRKFCKKAESHKGKPCVLIIDEINRANLSSVFGELMYLLEYRDEEIRLAGNGKLFGIPENVRIIGTMNTADRSVSPIDNALRRRFAFLHLPPNPDILDFYYKGTNFPIDDLKYALKYINDRIKNDNFQLGVSFFLLDKTLLNKELDKESYIAHIKDIWEMEITPYLKDNSFILNEELNKLILDEKLTWDEINQICKKIKKSDGSNTNS
ncbi:AAA family ATPase [Phormidium sp. LEGE 05292]|uniref:AAA family ATPase n=1 Tax=[Phormidium] sp. LEGE 05292 TaxID=767427 RepID=UPI00187EC8F2|nr:AAA family ATPase [Phormidium sp. LEGE 05292]MBE9226238.1 AAA family ATPase [Phormidium sp. LEGE 05292]